jgi:hypothetical protein
MAIGTDDLALGDLGGQRLSGAVASAHPGDVLRLLVLGKMIEV